MTQIAPSPEGTLLAGRYLLGEELGSGGMGSVFCATDLRTGGPVAVKLLHPALARNATYRERLRREAHIAASLTSPRVVRVVDLDEHDGIPFIVQEYVAGETLDRRLERDGHLPLPEALAIAREVARALEAAHAAGIVHRDLKPENIKLVDGQVKVLDFGIARAEGIPSLTATNAWVGTIEFCAPERALGQSDIRSDVYSLGVILFVLLTGRLPFAGPTPMAILRQHESAPPPIPDDLPHFVQAVLARCLAKRPEERYQRPADLVADLDDAIGQAVQALGGGSWAREAVRYPTPLTHRLLAGDDVTALLPAAESGGVPSHAAPTPKLVPQSNLPLQATSFVGRERERAEVRRLLATSRVLTLAGPGGIGKTRLALQLGAEVLESYLDGAWLVPLAPVAQPGQVAQAIAEALGMREEPGRSVAAALAEWLRPKRLLLILDNCEHVVGVCAELVQTLAQASPHLQVLATSREPLAIPGEVVWRVPPLDLCSEAAQLFAERAAAAHAGFQLTPDVEPVVAQICQGLDGLPLAIELAAARVKVLSVEEIAARLKDRFRLLKSNTRMALPHQQTLLAAIEWSYDLLPDDEQALFRRLGVFANGFTLEGAEAVCADFGLPIARSGGPPDFGLAEPPMGLLASHGAPSQSKIQNPKSKIDVLDGLAALVDKSLVSHETGAGGDSRYVMLHTIREYALTRLRAAGEEDAASIQHLDFCVRRAETAEQALRGGEQLTWLARLDEEHDNLRAVLDWCADPASPVAGVRGLRLATALGWYWYLRGHRTEGRRRLQKLLARAQAADASGVEAPGGARAMAQAVAAHLALWGLDPASAVPLADEACRLVREIGDPLVLAWTALYRAVVEPRQSSAESAKSRWQESLALFRAAGDNWGVALSLSWLGYIAFRWGDMTKAAEQQEEAQSLFRLLGDRWGIALVLGRLANMAEFQGDFARAEAYFEEQQTLARELGHQGALAGGLSRLAALSLRRGDVAQAQARFEQSLARFRDIGEQRSTAAPLRQLARLVARYHHDYTKAAALLAESLGVWHPEVDGVVGPIRGLFGCADIALLQGQRERAARLLVAAEAEIAHAGDKLDFVDQAQLKGEAADLRRALAAAGGALPPGQPPTLREAIAYALTSSQ